MTDYVSQREAAPETLRVHSGEVVRVWRSKTRRYCCQKAWGGCVPPEAEGMAGGKNEKPSLKSQSGLHFHPASCEGNGDDPTPLG